MKLIGWAIALAAAGLTPAAAQAPATAPPDSGASRADRCASGGFAQNPSAPDAPTRTAAAGQTPVARDSLGVPAPASTTRRRPELGVPSTAARASRSRSPPIGEEAAAFHDNWLLLLCAVISIFVLGLLLLDDGPLSPQRQSDAVAQLAQYRDRGRSGRWSRC